MTVVPERIRWAVEVLDPDPADHLLEIGCGPGVAAALVCARLEAGRLVAVDRSAVAVERTISRNAAHIAAGRLVVRQAALDALDVPAASFDTAYTINVNVFWTRHPGPELAVLAGALRRGGRLFVLYGAAGPTVADRVTRPIVAALRGAGFRDVEVLAGAGGTGVAARAP